jgi:hypothetical protein
LFAIGSDKKLNLLTSTSGNDAVGYKVLDLLALFKGYSSAVALDVSQDTTGKISVAFALKSADGNTIDVFFADRLSNDLGVTNFSQLPTLITKIQGLDPKFVAEHVVLGTSDDGLRPLMVIQGQLGTERYFYQLQASSDASEKMEFPENLNPTQNGLLGICMGYNFGQRANYFLYEIGETKSLVAITLATPDQGSMTFDYSAGNENLPTAFQQLTYNSIATVTSRADPQDPSSDIYIAAKSGVYRIPHGKASLMEKVTDTIKDAHEIVIASDASSISLWVAASPSYLYYIYGKKDSDDTAITWNIPVLFAQNALQVTPFKTNKTGANELFTVDVDMSVTHYWQDPTSTIWQHKTEKVKDDGYVLNYESYTSSVRFEVAGLPAVGTKVQITSSERQYCAINGLMYDLDQDVPAVVPTDSQGTITIISTAIDISPPVLHVRCKFGLLFLVSTCSLETS